MFIVFYYHLLITVVSFDVNFFHIGVEFNKNAWTTFVYSYTCVNLFILLIILAVLWIFLGDGWINWNVYLVFSRWI